MFFRGAEIRGGNVHACEVKQLTFLAFRSVAEAEAVADLAAAAQHGDTPLLDDARRRLQLASCTGAIMAKSPPECFVRDDCELIYRPCAERMLVHFIGAATRP